MIEQSLRGPFYGKSLTDIRAMVDERSVLAVAVETLDAIERTQPDLNAFVHVDRERVLADAAALDATTGQRGPLHGVPVGIKDLIDVAGWPVTSGSRLLARRIAQTDAEVVTSLRAAGALIVGMTLTHEFAFGGTGDVSKDGAARNPHDLGRMTGGSSAGSGAVSAAGLVPLALGTDTGGSVRIPSAFCGAVGIKTAYGDVPSTGSQDLAPNLDTIGVLAGDADVAWAGWSVLTGKPVPEAVAPTWSWLNIDRVPLIDPAVAALVREVFDAASDDATAEVSLGNWPEMRSVAASVMNREAYDVHAHQLDERRDDYEPSTWARIDAGRRVSDEQYAAARAQQAAWRQSLIDFLEPNQVLVSPTVGVTAPRIGERDMTVGGHNGNSSQIAANLTVRWNLAGFPGASVPAGEIDGLPVGLQIITTPGQEGALRAAIARVRDVVAPRGD
ncbi:amidase [Cumulibacter soli]|uniref:amidase n=1 Tax=Cumulibacter soli TaxID=2546344 RepID=UPI0010676751|nr:amidase [Cumulibacter soli]